MLYLWRFSIIDIENNVLRQDDIVAPTASDANFLYSHGQLTWECEELQKLTYRKKCNPQGLGNYYIDPGYIIMKNKIQIDCLGEVDVKLKTPVTEQNAPYKMEVKLKTP